MFDGMLMKEEREKSQKETKAPVDIIGEWCNGCKEKPGVS